jgi:hypothetical protein
LSFAIWYRRSTFPIVLEVPHMPTPSVGMARALFYGQGG